MEREMMVEKVRSYVGLDATDFDGQDEGGKYKVVPVAEPPAKIARRIKRCGGCHDSFYNGRMNCTGQSWCWSLKDDENFRKRGTPRCWHS